MHIMQWQEREQHEREWQEREWQEQRQQQERQQQERQQQEEREQLVCAVLSHALMTLPVFVFCQWNMMCADC
jgi:uncharacterized protein YhaN